MNRHPIPIPIHQWKARLAVAALLAVVWATVSALAISLVGGWEQAAMQWCIVVAAGFPLFLVILWWFTWEKTDWDAELVQLLEEMDR
jgi:hypothetical protein